MSETNQQGDPTQQQQTDPAQQQQADPTQQQQSQQQGDQQDTQQNQQSQQQSQQSSDDGSGQSERTVPQAADYKLPEGAPEDIRDWAHSNGFTQEQLDAAIPQFTKVAQGQKMAELQALRQQGEQFVKETWGDEAKYNLNLAKQALNANDPDGTLKQALNESGYGNHPAVLNFLHKVGLSLKEGGFIKSDNKTPQGSKSAAQVLFGNSHPSS